MAPSIDDLRKTIQEKKEKLGYLEQAIDHIKSLKAQEEAPGSADPDALRRQAEAVEVELSDIQNRIDNYKAKARELKNTIEQKKAAFEKITEDTRAERWAEVADEIQPMLDRVIEYETAIGTLELRKLENEQVQGMASADLEAHRQNAHKTSLDKDPRMTGVLQEIAEVRAELNTAEAQLAELQHNKK